MRFSVTLAVLASLLVALAPDALGRSRGPSAEEVIASKPTEDLDEKWGRGGFGPDMWVGIVYDGMKRE